MTTPSFPGGTIILICSSGSVYCLSNELSSEKREPESLNLLALDVPDSYPETADPPHSELVGVPFIILDPPPAESSAAPPYTLL